MRAFRYPRRILVRTLCRLIGKLILSLFSRTTITGIENFPRHGPIILAGNHVAFLEALLMVVYPPYLVELIGTGDIPMEPQFAWLTKLYGYISINRGNLDRTGLRAAANILNQQGVLGIFPEGGIWKPAAMQAQTGVAWLSHETQSPVVPIGFGGMRGAIQSMLKLQRPRLMMNVGPAIDPIQIHRTDISRKAALAEGAALIMERIHRLIPAEEREFAAMRFDECYQLQIKITSPDGSLIPIPQELLPVNGSELAKFLHQPVLLRVFTRNLKMPVVSPLQTPHRNQPARAIERAAQAVIDYLQVNRGFLIYRFGMDEGLLMEAGIIELRSLSSWAAKQGYFIDLNPIYTYTDKNGSRVQEDGRSV
jgi:1-acyl-sn-glycerol-3-phosphate acyltransferase